MQWLKYVTELPTKGISLRGNIRRNKAFLYEILLIKTYKLLKKILHRYQQDLPSMDLHNFRIRSKRLRYFIESFPKLLESTQIKPAYKRFKQLQKILGQHQDNVMLEKIINEQSEAIDAEISENKAAKQALEMWIKLAAKRQRIARELSSSRNQACDRQKTPSGMI